MDIWTILLVVVAAAALFVVFTYNRLVRLRTRVQEAWSDIQVQMKRRYDLVPNLVETVRAYAAHERDTLEGVVQARNAAMADAGTPDHQARSEGALQATLKSLFALAENYPQLRADGNFARLQADLGEIETHINMSRRYYNGAVRELNVTVAQFPSNLVAGPFGFTAQAFFELDEAEAEAAARPVPVAFPSRG
jgi:LemA protein